MAVTMTKAELRELSYTHDGQGRAVRVGSGEGAPSVDGHLTGSTAPRSPYRNKWEAERAAVLDIRKRTGSIADWRYEGIRLKLADGAWYKPDFMVVHNSGFIELEEVKGHWREAAKVRWKVAVAQFPMFSFSLWTKQDGRWVETEHHHRRAA